MENTNISLLGKRSSINVRKVLWTLEALGLPYELEEEWGSGHRDTNVPEFLALNPNAMVPVLRDGALVLYESNTICRYLAGAYGKGALLPAEPARRAMVEQWMDWQATELNPAWRHAFMGLVRGSPQFADAAGIEASAAAWNAKMRILESQLEKTGAYAAGSSFSLADIVLGLSTNRWKMTPIEHAALPAVEAWYARLASEAGFNQFCANGTP
ncbi:glutathione S-transferase family protein [Massilia endophytica]|uniref:glutathione S-transferase family protein n=1 Tax=Massilia endophytica TaxID=2899220 RepID=UPI001E357855|nr:glutathione S-transferase [Massilia endophytica]UGQ45357.1 glutathione S-transferase [Massilia endophytica]